LYCYHHESIMLIGIPSYVGSLFSIRGPRDTTALLDIERAFNKLEKVALNRRKIGSTPLILIINSTHLVRDDHDGQDLLEMIQQRAEQWAASGLVTTSKTLANIISSCHRLTLLLSSS
jgi:transcriptional regulator of nitric oxide reductase